MQLKDKVVLITGSSRGIGKAIAIAFANEGAKIVVNYNSSHKKANQVVETIKQIGGEAIAVKANIGDTDEIRTLFKKAKAKFKKIDILVNNAGIYKRLSFKELNKKDWDEEMNINLTAQFFTSQEFAKQTKKGKIINIASTAGIKPKKERGILYGLTKAGVIYLTKSLALTLAPQINVNAIAPGYVRTDMIISKNNPKKEAQLERILPLHHINDPEDIAKAALYLASEQSKNVTGQILVVDGGFSLT